MKDIKPLHYKIHIEPDLIHFKFSGTTEILMEISNPTSEITLNALDLNFISCKVKIEKDVVDCLYHPDSEKEEIKVFLPREMKERIVLIIDYTGEINDKMVGFYRSSYLKEGEERYIALTQFQESDARRAFPCFDHPSKKAFFDVEVIIDEGFTAISNGQLDKEEYVSDGKKLIQFQQTPKMSPYLLFLGVGEFESIEDKGEVTIRGITMPGMTQFARFGLEFGRKSLEFCENYYGVKYPLPKLDLIAIPDFAAGAMENWGAITFRENLLLYYPHITSRAGKERICEVIAHEMAHQWFGNLVTPSDWKYLWLNESFATYVSYGVLNSYFPEWEIWDKFLHGQTDVALERDALKETDPIEIPGGEHVVINASTAPIIYNKGGSILKQIEGYVGWDNLRSGLRHYLKKHGYDCASSRNLWEALEEVCEKPVTDIMRSWIEQPGYPVVEVKKHGKNLVLTQRRFTYLPGETNQQWIIPVNIKIFKSSGESEEISSLLMGKDTSIKILNDVVAYKVNYGQMGFYRTKYVEEQNIRALGQKVKSKELPPEDRWGIQNDLYALVKGGEYTVDNYLDFLFNYTDEDAFLPLTSIAKNLLHTYLITEGARKEKVASFGKSFSEDVLSKIQYQPEEDEKHTTSLLRDQILWNAVIYGSEIASNFAFDHFSELMRGGFIHPDLMRSIMQTGAWKGHERAFEWFDKRLKTSESEHERMNVLVAMGSFREKPFIEKVLQYILDHVPHRNKFIPICAMATNPYAMHSMWAWYLSNLTQLESLHPIQYERIIAEIIPFCGIGREEEIVTFFEDYMKKRDKGKETIKLSLERLEINRRIRTS